MALFSKRSILDRADSEIKKSYNTKSASNILNESGNIFFSNRTYDIFISHSYQDAKIILGVKKTL